MITARDLIRKKGSAVYSVAPGSLVIEALKTMASRNLGALLVMEDDKVVGILSERDCVRKLDLEGRAAQKTRVQDIMTDKVLYVEGGQLLEECMALMTSRNIRHLPVFDDGKLMGIMSVRDVLKEIIDDQKFLISHLEHYILGERG
jgi:CBS domain-containing protein